MCGGTPTPGSPCGSGGGLSPRVRGNRAGRYRERARRRSIPACAGEPDEGVGTRAGGQVYPRVCGEPPVPFIAPPVGEVYPRVCGGTVGGRAPRAARSGLSPRVRGNQTNQGQAGRDTTVYPRVWRGNPPVIPCWIPSLGSIPACAGEPRGRDLASRWSSVYPRVCGGTRYRADYPVYGQGLSPRVRGNQSRLGLLAGGHGSIPACAGEPRCWTPGRSR